MDVKVEVRNDDQGGLDEVLLYVDGRCLFHLEQMSDTHWWMALGEPEGQYVHVNLTTRRATIRGQWTQDGPAPPGVKGA